MTIPLPIATVPAGSAPITSLTADVCVVGGGMSGLCAAITAARNGAKVILVQDRAVLGGNASSEVRMWVCGAHGKEAKETGLIEEILLENTYRNPSLNYPIWDTVLYEKAQFQDNLTLKLSCAVCEVTTDKTANGSSIQQIKAWHLTEQRWYHIAATQFIDCSGDSILRLSGAETRWGREARDEFNESHAPEVADRKTMGNSLLLQLREIDPDQHRPFVRPDWAHDFSDDRHLRVRESARPTGCNFWWIEIGGLMDTITDSDAIRDELYKIAYGVWAYIKNHPDGRGHRWELEWLGSLPGKRENVRYVGDHILTQNDIEAFGDLDDVVCHGGWTMDDHFPAAFHHDGPPTIFHPAPSPFGIPYRCLYSKNIDNLFCAGRNISCTHMAMSATRVMATCATMGQAAGTAAALAIRYHTSPRGIYQHHLKALQNTLLEDDQYVPARLRPMPSLTTCSTMTSSAGSTDSLTDGTDRTLHNQTHSLHIPSGGHVLFRFAQASTIGRVRIVGDSQLHRSKRMACSYPKTGHNQPVPEPLPRDLTIEVERSPGIWETAATITNNRRRLISAPIAGQGLAVRISIQRTWGAEAATLYACDVGEFNAQADITRTAWPTQTLKAHGAA